MAATRAGQYARKLKQPFAAARAQVQHAARRAHELTYAVGVRPGWLLLDHPACQVRKVPAGKGFFRFLLPCGAESLAVHVVLPP